MNILLTGLAKSGTTLLFTRIRNSLPAASRTCFEPIHDADIREVLAASSGNGDAAPDSVTKILIGHPCSESEFIKRFDKHVLIVRDPRDRLISHLLYNFYDFKDSGDHAGFAAAYAMLEEKVKSPAAVSCFDLYNNIARLVRRPGANILIRQYALLRRFCEAQQPFIVKYEAVLNNDVAALERYLEFNLSPDAEVDSEYARVVRSRSAGEWKDWLTVADQQHVNAVFDDILGFFGYGNAELVPAISAIRPETSLGYVAGFRPGGGATAS